MHRRSSINSIAEILRDKETKAASLKINRGGAWKLYVGTTVQNINLSQPILEGKGRGTYPLNVSRSLRCYFILSTPGGNITLSDSHLPMTGAYNLRDMGGIKTKDGRSVKWGRLFRSDDLTNLTKEDLAYLGSIPIISVIDFRAIGEINRSPDKLPNSVIYNYPLSITPVNLSKEGIEANLLSPDLSNTMIQSNRSLVTEKACISAYQKFFFIVQHKRSAPLIYHCSAGKDRTGLAAALILSALGVDEDTIMQDYLLSKVYLEDKYAPYIVRYPRAAPLFTVKKKYLEAGLNQIKSDHGSIENFLTKILKVDIEKMKEMYLD